MGIVLFICFRNTKLYNWIGNEYLFVKEFLGGRLIHFFFFFLNISDRKNSNRWAFEYMSRLYPHSIRKRSGAKTTGLECDQMNIY